MRKNTFFKYDINDYLKHDYYQKIKEYLEDRDILDVGCVGHNFVYANINRLWNHWFVCMVGKSVLGIDIEKESVNQMKMLGFNVKVESAEDINYRNHFDTIFAGELIEHLPNPGKFLINAKKALKPGGTIVLSTPNTYGLNKIIRAIQFRTNQPPENTDHTMYFTPKNLESLANKCGLRLIKVEYAYFPFVKESLLVKLNKLGCKILGDKFKEQILVILH